ncbi:MAG: hypothetical protein V3T84_10205 [Phycisphaerales bacterium]
MLYQRVDDERHHTAFHESGHAVAAYRLGWPFSYVTIEPSDMTAGHLHSLPVLAEPLPYLGRKDRIDIVRSVKVSLAGVIATRAAGFHDPYDGSDGDYMDVLALLNVLCDGIDDLETTIVRLADETAEMLREQKTWALVEAVASALLHRRTLGYRAVHNLAMRCSA